MTTETRTALLVDGENLSVDHAGFAIVTAAKRGALTIKRVYGGVTRLGGWAAAPGFRVIHTPSGKNAGDIALSLDALEIALTRQADEFVIATSDRDLALVAMRLAELGFRVTGIGEADKAPLDFRKACREFITVPAKALKGDQTTAPPADFEARLRAFMQQENSQTDGWVTLNMLGQQRAKDRGISKAEAKIGTSGSWLAWFKKRPQVYEVDERGTQSRARIKSQKSSKVAN